MDVGDVTGVEGVRGVFTAADLDLKPIRAELSRPLSEFVPTDMPVLAYDVVRYVGEPLAIVVAADAYSVEDGLEAARVSYRTVTAVTSADQAMSEGVPLVHDSVPNNTVVDVQMFATDGIDEIFDDAHTVVSVQSRTGRQNALPLETRGCIAYWDDRDEQLIIYICTQVPHQVRTVTALCLGLDERQVRVVVPDMGGGFGQKCVVGREEIAVAAAALKLRRP
nr:molybdopterin cofactor-binding domain-containing protein [Rhodococcus fascians]